MGSAGDATISRRAHHLFSLLVGILLVYGLIVGFSGQEYGDGGRILVLGVLLLMALRIRRRRGRALGVATALAVGALVVAVIAALVGGRLAAVVIALDQVMLTGATIAALIAALVAWRTVDLSTVLGVLCVYLLLALFFANLHELGAAFSTGYLNGVAGEVTSGDCLYLSVMTLATVGFGDVTPATGFGRTIAITEAMVGQLYLVSVVAGVVGGWRASRT